MEIDYTKIIEAANTRKDDLFALEYVLSTIDVNLNKLEELLAYSTLLHNIFSHLDEEGRNILPLEVRKALEHWSFVVNFLERAKYSENSGFYKLKEAME